MLSFHVGLTTQIVFISSCDIDTKTEILYKQSIYTQSN